MGQQVKQKLWIVREQIVADPVSGLTLEFTVAEDGTQSLTLYGDCLVFGNRTIVFERDGETIHGETAIPAEVHCYRANGNGDEESEEPYRSRIRAPR